MAKLLRGAGKEVWQGASATGVPSSEAAAPALHLAAKLSLGAGDLRAHAVPKVKSGLPSFIGNLHQSTGQLPETPTPTLALARVTPSQEVGLLCVMSKAESHLREDSAEEDSLLREEDSHLRKLNTCRD